MSGMWVDKRKMADLFGWTEGQLLGYRERHWTRNQHYALIAGVIQYNPKEIIKWQNIQVLSQAEQEELQSAGNIREEHIIAPSTRSLRRKTSQQRLGSVKSGLQHAS